MRIDPARLANAHYHILLDRHVWNTEAARHLAKIVLEADDAYRASCKESSQVEPELPDGVSWSPCGDGSRMRYWRAGCSLVLTWDEVTPEEAQQITQHYAWAKRQSASAKHEAKAPVVQICAKLIEDAAHWIEQCPFENSLDFAKELRDALKATPTQQNGGK